MADISEIMSEMVDAQALTRTSTAPTIQASAVKALAVKIQQLGGFDTKAAVSLCTALDAASFPEPHKNTIQGAIDARLQAHSSSSARPTANKAALQLLTSPSHYLTTADWAAIDAPSTSAKQMIEIIASRYAKLGVRHLDEQTCRTAVGVVLHARRAQDGGLTPAYSAIHDWVREFKQEFHTGAKLPWTHDIIAKYPASPAELPASIQEAAYDATDPPVTKPLPGLQQLLPNVPLRSDNRLLVAERARLQSTFAMQPWAQALNAMPVVGHLTPLQRTHAVAQDQQSLMMGMPTQPPDPIPDMRYPARPATAPAEGRS